MAAKKNTCRNNWRDDCSSILDFLKHSHNTGLFSDVTFSVSGEIIRGHSLILALNSPVFEAMLFGSMPRNDVIQVKDVQPKTFRQLLSFMYGADYTLQNMSINDAIDLWILADRYIVTRLCSKLKKQLGQNLSKDLQHVIPVYQASLLLSDEDLSKKCLDLIKNATDQIITKRSCLSLTKESFQIILNEDRLQIDEAVLFECLFAWGSASCRELGGDIRSQVTGLIEKIRFLNFTPKQFSNVPVHSKILTQEECYGILLALSSSKTDTMPDGFSLKKRRRPQQHPGHTIDSIPGQWFSDGVEPLAVVPYSQSASYRGKLNRNNRQVNQSGRRGLRGYSESLQLL